MKESEKYRFWNFSRGERFAVIFLPVIDVENDSAQQASQQHFEYPEHEQMSANRIPV